MSYEEVLADCEKILRSSNRNPADIRLLAVSKLQPVEKIRDLYQRGQHQFAENYVQEALDKQQSLTDLSIEWHLIGSLQKNKAKLVIGRFALIHSVDSLKLAKVLSDLAGKKNCVQKILLQVNVAAEDTKSGFSTDELRASWTELLTLPHLQFCGLMTMPPLTEEPEAARPHFRALRELLHSLRQQTSAEDICAHPMNELSMGTSHDYHIAIEEGATIVRLGTVLFGERPQHRTQQL